MVPPTKNDPGTLDTGKPRSETWVDWMPKGAPLPEDRELLTREELLNAVAAKMADLRAMHEMIEDPDSEHHRLMKSTISRSSDFAMKVAPRTLREWETLGILPRPIRRKVRGASRAVYPRWHVDAVVEVASSKRYGTSPEFLRTCAKRMYWIRVGSQTLAAQPETQALAEALDAYAEAYARLGEPRPSWIRVTFQDSDRRDFQVFNFEGKNAGKSTESQRKS